MAENQHIFGESTPVIPAQEEEQNKDGKKVDNPTGDKKPDGTPTEDPKLKELSENLSKQNKIIEDLTKKLKEKETKPTPEEEEAELPYKKEELVLTKDMKEEDLEEMTENEKKMHDDMVKFKQQANDRAKADKASKSETEKQIADIKEQDVQKMALEKAGGDIETANKVIEKLKLFGDILKMNPETLQARLEDAVKLAEVKTTRKENETFRGNTVKSGADGGSGGSSVDKIIEEVAASRSNVGGYSL